MLEGLVFDIKKFSIHDGPGIRTTVFLKGCPLSCAWCQNPESQSPDHELLYRPDRCLVCGTCADSCPEGAVFISGNRVLTLPEKCKLCGSCTESCPSEARELVGRKMCVEEVVDEISKDQVFYEESSGGVTFSGGEPLMQPRFLLALLERCGGLGIHRAVDTSGFVPEGVLSEVASETDLFLYDLKHMDPEKHQEFTGVSNSRIIRNLLLLARSDADINVRVPLIGGFNSDDENVRETASFIASLPKSCKISLLPFHERAEDKHRRFGMDYEIPQGAKLPEVRLREIQGIFLDYGLSAQIGG